MKLHSVVLRYLFILTSVLAKAFPAAEPAGTLGPGVFALFNGKDLAGWSGWAAEAHPTGNLPASGDLERGYRKTRNDLAPHWRVEAGELISDGHGPLLISDQEVRDFELRLSFRSEPQAVPGIILKGCPLTGVRNESNGPRGFEGSSWLGSGPVVLSNPRVGEWNDVRVIQCGARTWVWFNGNLLLDGGIMKTGYARTLPRAATEPIEPLRVKGSIQLQSYGGEIRWRSILLRKISSLDANSLVRGEDPVDYTMIFNGRNFDGWAGPLDACAVKNGAIVWQDKQGGTIYTKEEYSDFVVRLEFRLPAGGNNGLAIRYPGAGNTAYDGMCECQVLDDDYEKVRGNIDPRQAHGSAYGMVPAARGYQRPLGEWNYQEVTVVGSTLKVELNGTVILDCDLSRVTEYMGNHLHPGKDRKSGHFGFAGHRDPGEFRNISIKRLD